MDSALLSGKAERVPASVAIATFDWDDSLRHDPDAFRFALTAARASRAEVKELINARNKFAAIDAKIQQAPTGRPTVAPKAHRWFPELDRATNIHFEELYARISDWWNDRSFDVQSSQDVEVRIPLFFFGAPSPKGCGATLTASEQGTTTLGFGIKVFGTGVAASASIEISTEAEFSASSGETKVVFIPATLKVEKGKLLQGGRPIWEGCRVNGAEIRATSELGILRLKNGAETLPGALAKSFDLADDAPGGKASYSYTCKATGSVGAEVGFKAFGSDLTLKLERERSRSASLTYELRGGRVYELYHAKGQDGVVWGRPERERASKRKRRVPSRTG